MARQARNRTRGKSSRRIQSTEIAVDWTHFALDLLSIGDFCNAKVIYRLKIQPRLRITAEIAGEPQRLVRRNTAALTHDIVDTRGGHMQRLGEGIHAQAGGT